MATNKADSEGKIIPLETNQAYMNALKHNIDVLEQMESNIQLEMISLATSGKWKKWSDEQPDGTEFTFTEEMLRDTGDKNVDLLYELLDKMTEIREKFNII